MQTIFGHSWEDISAMQQKRYSPRLVTPAKFESPSQGEQRRFRLFKQALKSELGDHADFTVRGEVIIAANEFTPSRYFKTLQSAIDNFARYMPSELL
jgi:hypothetical protein